jgi:hypothetical protein
VMDSPCFDSKIKQTFVIQEVTSQNQLDIFRS